MLAAGAGASASPTPPNLAVIVPTLNEKDNIEPLLARLDEALAGIAWEAVFVDDDSQDGTAALLLHLQSTRPGVRVIRRIGRRGLSSACIEGMLATGAPFLAVMDADLQHDETILPRMLDANPRRTVIRRELMERVEAALATLPDYHRQVIVLREIEGLSYEEMAEILEVPKGTIMSRLFHARRKMQVALQDFVEGGDLEVEE